MCTPQHPLVRAPAQSAGAQLPAPGRSPRAVGRRRSTSPCPVNGSHPHDKEEPCHVVEDRRGKLVPTATATTPRRRRSASATPMAASASSRRLTLPASIAPCPKATLLRIHGREANDGRGANGGAEQTTDNAYDSPGLHARVTASEEAGGRAPFGHVSTARNHCRRYRSPQNTDARGGRRPGGPMSTPRTPPGRSHPQPQRAAARDDGPVQDRGAPRSPDRERWVVPIATRSSGHCEVESSHLSPRQSASVVLVGSQSTCG